jgi:hypothetical protein
MNKMPEKIVALVIATALFSEMFLMTILHLTDTFHGFWIVLDSLLLIILLSPVLFFFIYKPLNQQINIQKQLVADKEALVDELQGALSEIKTLRGILPICSFCKNIRNDEGYYEQIEGYIHKHSGVDFSHTICPPCMEKHYPEEFASIAKKKGV